MSIFRITAITLHTPIGRLVILKTRSQNYNDGLDKTCLSFDEDRERKFLLMKIAITGGAGFIGSHLAKAYLNAGHDVLIIDNLINGSPEAVDPRARFYRMDIRDSKLQVILQRERPD